jgi:predicted RNase H-like HicB family nuclease
MRFVVIIEKGPTSYGAYAPDVPGCIAVGETADEALRKFSEALEAHLQLMADDGEPLPVPASTPQWVDVAVPQKPGAAPTGMRK